MKKRNYIALLATILLGFSCNDVLETIPTDRLSSEIYWQTVQDAEYAANAIYDKIEGFDRILQADNWTDIAHHNFYGGDHVHIEKGIATSQNNTMQDFWKLYWEGVRLCNDYMANVDKIETEDTATLNKYTGEVKTLRAYFYFRLASLYGGVPLLTEPITIEEGRTVSRDTEAAIWKFVEDELDEAIPLLSWTTNQPGRITKGSALAIKAKAMLYIGKYTEAAAAAKQIIDNETHDLYESYQGLFTYEGQNNKEVLFGKQFTKDNYSSELMYNFAPRSLGGNGPTMAPLFTLIEAYEMKDGKKITDANSGYDERNPYTDRDPRLSYSVMVPGDVMPNGAIYNPVPGSGTQDEYATNFQVSTTGYTTKKYLNPEDVGSIRNCGINLIIIRYAEILLTYAEAKIELNDIDQSVVDAINQIRQRPDVDMPPISIGSQAEMRERVRHERLVELALEGVRYLDIKRWKIAPQACSGNLRCMTYVDENGELQKIIDTTHPKGFTDPKHYYWPIPHRERLMNSNLEQNPGWE